MKTGVHCLLCEVNVLLRVTVRLQVHRAEQDWLAVLLKEADGDADRDPEELGLGGDAVALGVLEKDGD